MRLIDADALMEECYEELKDNSLWYDKDTSKDYADGHDEGKRIMMAIIDQAPTIEPKRGEWINVSGSWSPNEKCSVCGEVVHEYNYNFCPYCGADMREREGE